MVFTLNIIKTTSCVHISQYKCVISGLRWIFSKTIGGLITVDGSDAARVGFPQSSAVNFAFLFSWTWVDLLYINFNQWQGRLGLKSNHPRFQVCTKNSFIRTHTPDLSGIVRSAMSFKYSNMADNSSLETVCRWNFLDADAAYSTSDTPTLNVWKEYCT